MKHIICFDGTTNDMEPGEGESLTNVAKLAQRCSAKDQLVHYISGPGTRGNAFTKLYRAALAPERTIGRIINMGGRHLAQHYRRGDEVHIVAFSRGAAIGRRLASLIRDYIDPGDGQPVHLWLFDTVASIGAPDVDPKTNVLFENATMAPHVKQAVHAVSIDERRSVGFPVTLLNRDARVKEVWFAGVHSSVGGGQPTHGLSDIALRFMIDEMRAAKLQVNEPAKPDTPDPLGEDYPIERIWSDARRVCVWKGDVPDPDQIPLVHHTVGARQAAGEYDPDALRGVRFHFTT